MTKLTETPVATDINLTDHQKQVICKIVAAPTDKVAGEEISQDEKLVAARDILVKLGIITFENNRAALTDKGMQLAKDNNLIDETGQLTEVGQKYAYVGEEQEPAGDVGGIPDLNFGESISFLREINRLVEEGTGTVISVETDDHKLIRIDVEKSAQHVAGQYRQDKQNNPNVRLWDYVDSNNKYFLLDPTKQEATSRADLNQMMYDYIRKNGLAR